jgi:predicted NBD/HSP70 family sugar kinase
VSQPGTPSLLRAINDRAALDLLLSAGPLTRAEIGARTGLSKVTASQLLSRLEARGLVEVVGSQTGTRGPNAALYAVVGAAGHAAGVDVGPDGITVAVTDIAGDMRGRATVTGRSDDLIADVLGALRAALRQAGVARGELRSVVIGTPGVVDPATGEVDLAVDVPAWHPGLPLALRERLQCPVTVENDVNLAALAERSHGHAVDVADFVLLWVGRGLGLAVVLGGRLHRGASGGAGEVGYLPVPGAPLPTSVTEPRAAAFQYLVSAEAVLALAATHGLEHSSASAAVAAAVATNHPMLDVLSERLAVGLAAICVVLDPSLVVLSGDVGCAGGAALASRIQRAVTHIAPVHPTVVVSGIAGNAVLAGALQVATAMARDAVFDAPA